MRSNCMLPVVALCLSFTARTQDDTPKLNVSGESLTREQAAVYRAVLQDVLSNSKPQKQIDDATERAVKNGLLTLWEIILTKNAIAHWLAITLCAASCAGTATFWFLRKSAESGRLTRLVKAGFRERLGDHSVTPPPNSNFVQ